MKRVSLKGNKFIYVALVAVVIAVGVVVAAFVENQKTTSSPQYTVYRLNQAVEKGDKAEFEKYYAVREPGQANADPESEQGSALEEYKEDFYTPISLGDAKKARTINETRGGGKVIYLPAGKKEVVLRLAKQGKDWKVVDIVKIDKVKTN